MTNLIDAARQVCEHWSGSGLAQAVRDLQSCLDGLVVADDETLDKAREIFSDDSSNAVEIDEGALASQAEDGLWVQAWVRVPDSSG